MKARIKKHGFKQVTDLKDCGLNTVRPELVEG
jgi:hypothetical protein